MKAEQNFLEKLAKMGSAEDLLKEIAALEEATQSTEVHKQSLDSVVIQRRGLLEQILTLARDIEKGLRIRGHFPMVCSPFLHDTVRCAYTMNLLCNREMRRAGHGECKCQSCGTNGETHE